MKQKLKIENRKLNWFLACKVPQLALRVNPILRNEKGEIICTFPAAI